MAVLSLVVSEKIPHSSTHVPLLGKKFVFFFFLDNPKEENPLRSKKSAEQLKTALETLQPSPPYAKDIVDLMAPRWFLAVHTAASLKFKQA